MKFLLPMAVLLLAGCATSPPSAVIPSGLELRAAAPGFSNASVRLHPAAPGFRNALTDPRFVADELRIVDSRAIRELVRSDPLRVAAGLTGPQKVAVIAGATIVGAYLISEWIEDNVAFFP